LNIDDASKEENILLLVGYYSCLAPLLLLLDPAMLLLAMTGIEHA
jgi:hypothetical protein